MKYLIFFVFLAFFHVNLFAQKMQYAAHLSTFWDKGLSNFLENNNTYAYTNTVFQTEFGIEAMYKLNKSFGLGLGYDFSYRFMEVNLFTGNPVSSFSGTKIYTHDVPLFFEYRKNLKSGTNRAIVARIGGGIEFFEPEYIEFGRTADETIFTTTFRYGLYYTMYTPKDPIPFLQAYVGILEGFGPKANFGLGIGYKYLLSSFEFELYNYFKNFNSPPAIIGYTRINRNLSDISLRLTYLIR